MDTESDTKLVEPDLPGPFEGASLIDLLREEVREVSETKFVYIPIQGFGKTGLAARYVLPESGKQLENISNKVNREFKTRFERNLYSAIDTMILLCAGLYIRTPDVEEYIELDPELLGEPVQFDMRLAETLGFVDCKSARTVVRRIFGNNDIAIMTHAEKLSRWLQNTSVDVNTQLWEQNLGE